PKCTLNPNVRCNTCGKTGHLQRVCFQGKQGTNQLDEVLNLTTDLRKARAKISTTLQVNQKSLEFEIDTGAAVSVIGIENARRLFPDKELDRLCKEGILEKVNTSRWATPIVPVLKKNNQVRICGDFSVSLNPHLIVDEHPLPTTDELFTSMEGCTIFSKIDLQNAYLQLMVREEDCELLTLNTHRGLCKSKRLMYGVASAPAIWQRSIETILQGIQGVVVFLDDIRIGGRNEEDHWRKLQKVLDCLQKHNVKINFDKSEFAKKKIQYCGYLIDKNGVHKCPEKMEAIRHMRRPQNITELRSFLGLINYYGRFIENLSDIVFPLNKLLQKNSTFNWTESCEKAFNNAKQAFLSEKCLAHFNPKLPLVLATDASSYGVGAVLSHTFPDGTEKVLQYASQTLSTTQRKYSQIDKEAYAIIFGIKKFHQFLYGNSFTLLTDHRSLVQIFSPQKSLPLFSALRMQHYGLFLRGFNYKIKYRKSAEHANADCLSRLPLSNKIETHDVIDAFLIETVNSFPIDAKIVKAETQNDVNCQKLCKILEEKQGKAKRTFWNIDLNEFREINGVLMRDHRIVIPTKLRKQMLQELHVGHFGMTKMKNLARSYFWWSGLDQEIEDLVRNCANCNTYKNNPKKEVHLWEEATEPFQRIHIDFAGPFLDKTFFILIDAFSKWPI
ncbi:PREDICTED: uncharacterized protein K02A2.6-like, partial [Vollenhovia emeryi]|uniref:uncharacterized protein K02A2.6-like n=1 Tax=Vollenhovia emeryi TaxID=411798 RepID=UPI0005F562D4